MGGKRWIKGYIPALERISNLPPACAKVWLYLHLRANNYQFPLSYPHSEVRRLKKGQHLITIRGLQEETSYEERGRKRSLSRATILSAIERLEKEGLISVEKRKRGRNGYLLITLREIPKKEEKPTKAPPKNESSSINGSQIAINGSQIKLNGSQIAINGSHFSNKGSLSDHLSQQVEKNQKDGRDNRKRKRIGEEPLPLGRGSSPDEENEKYRDLPYSIEEKGKETGRKKAEENIPEAIREAYSLIERIRGLTSPRGSLKGQPPFENSP